MNQSKNKQYFKLLLLGDSGVGKTAIIQKYINYQFNSQFKSTVGVDFLHKAVNIDDREVVMQIWDTAGQERYQSLGYSYYRSADCCALVFDLSDSDSFERAAKWRDIFLKFADPLDKHTFPFVLIGNKCDLKKRQVHHIKAKEWCQNLANQCVDAVESIRDSQLQSNLGDNLDPIQVKYINRQKRNEQNYTIPYFEVSAKTGTNVDEVFETMLKLAMAHSEKFADQSKKKLMLYDKADDQMFNEQGLYLKKMHIKNKEKMNGGCSCYYN
ncbi:ras-related protein rab-7a [Stylonychia lemnae]|uniref:Ras-related protein rab-7a n=1 Tax=Stylonychia lemnae TaxID=5949 RepID=A0A078AK21_STYLE|nr:ras-related protein rab-7a [Stylonychia lemnae]|eukprot:CDW81153.1 ras-related protein rab-7a [Stylonychia lemnae]